MLPIPAVHRNSKNYQWRKLWHTIAWKKSYQSDTLLCLHSGFHSLAGIASSISALRPSVYDNTAFATENLTNGLYLLCHTQTRITLESMTSWVRESKLPVYDWCHCPCCLAWYLTKKDLFCCSGPLLPHPCSIGSMAWHVLHDVANWSLVVLVRRTRNMRRCS